MVFGNNYTNEKDLFKRPFSKPKKDVANELEIFK